MVRKAKSKAAPRLKKKAITEILMNTFNDSPEKAFNVKELFGIVHATNHPAKMLVVDALSDLVLDDYISTDGNGIYRNAVRSNVMEGTFRRKRNGHNSFVPDDGGKSILVCERNSLHCP